MKYPLAPNGIFYSIQGEGSMLGKPMVFIRLAGCSVKCHSCDTDYRVHERLSVPDIMACVRLLADDCKWVWITGGEPMDHDLVPLLTALREERFRQCLCTSGHYLVPEEWTRQHLLRFLSVSPHQPGWAQRIGNEVKLVPGLNGYHLRDFKADIDGPNYFGSRYVMPCDGRPDTVRECVDFVREHPGWHMTVQAHKQWGLS